MEWLNPYHLQVASFVLINAILGVSIYVTLSTGQLSLGNAGFMSIGAYTAALLSTQHQVPIPAGILAGSLLAGAAGSWSASRHFGFPASTSPSPRSDSARSSGPFSSTGSR